MKELFKPDSIAIVGASRDASKWGGRIIRNLRQYEFGGAIYPVNPSADAIEGYPCFPDIESLPLHTDMAIVAVGADQAITSVRELGERGVPVATVLASGFAEMGDEGQQLQYTLSQTAAKAGIRVLGPNSVGVINLHNRMIGSGASSLIEGLPPTGGLSIVSQSGAIGISLLLVRAAERGVGIATVTSTGNESDLTTEELLEYLASDPDTDRIALFLEGVRDGRRLVRAVERARTNGKPVSVLKAGQSQQGVRAAATHTGLLAGEGRVFRGAMESVGAHVCNDIDDLLEQVLLTAPIVQTNGHLRVAAMSTSGGLNALLVDALSEAEIPLAMLEDRTLARLRACLPPFNPVGNPVDIGGQVSARMDVQYEVLRCLVEDQNVDGVVVLLTAMPQYMELFDLLTSKPIDYGSTFVAVVDLGSSVSREMAMRCQRDLGFPSFTSIARCARAINNAAAFRLRRTVANESGQEDEARQALQQAGPLGHSRPESSSSPYLIQKKLASSNAQEQVLIDLLEERGLRYVPSNIAHEAEQAVVAARDLGFPVVVKARTQDLPHKTDSGAVFLSVGDEEAVRSAVSGIRLATNRVGRTFSGVVVQKQINDGLEFLLGGHFDQQFGPIVTLAHGGVLANLLDIGVSWPAPLEREDARRMIDHLSWSEILVGYRGRSPSDILSLENALIGASQLISQLTAIDESYELDINPVLVLARGEGMFVVDALLTKKTDSHV